MDDEFNIIQKCVKIQMIDDEMTGEKTARELKLLSDSLKFSSPLQRTLAVCRTQLIMLETSLSHQLSKNFGDVG